MFLLILGALLAFAGLLGFAFIGHRHGRWSGNNTMSISNAILSIAALLGGTLLIGWGLIDLAMTYANV